MENDSKRAEQLASILIRGIHRVNKIRDALYLDTCAWSNLAKGAYSPKPIAKWCREKATFVWLSRFQLGELSADTRLARPLGKVLQEINAVVIDRELNEFSGDPWHKVKVSLEMPLILNSNEALDAFAEMMISGPIRPTNHKLRDDAEEFKKMIESMLTNVPSDRKRSWRDFPKALRSWIDYHCAKNGKPVCSDGYTDPERYVGLKLSFGIIFLRYYLNKQTWKGSDYVDYLHCSDMPYARTVVTERNLGECIRQVTRAIPGLGPQEVHDLKWLASPV
jgi:hypothetical protein